ncbi:flagellar motor switch protein FliN [Halomonas sp. LS-001]
MTDPNKPDDQNVSDDDWAAAMSEQETNDDTADTDDAFDQHAPSDTDSQNASGMDEEEDPWAAAMAEQQSAEENAPAAEDPAPEPPKAREASGDVFPPLSQSTSHGSARDLEMIMDIPVKLTVELGRTKLTIKQLLELAQGSVIELEGLAGEPMDILINGYLIAQGEVVVIEDKYGIRITEIITPSERIHKLNR